MSRERGLLPLCFRTGLQIAQVEGLQTEEKSLEGGKVTKVETHWFFFFFGWEENKPTIWKNFCAVESWVCLLLISCAQVHQMGLVWG